MLIGQEHLLEAQDTEGAVAQVEPVTTWREALSARLRPGDHHVSAEEIFAILNDGNDGGTTADLCAAKGVTVPMYCVWKLKYRQLPLDQLRAARRREQLRHHTVIGLVVLTAVLVMAGIAVSLVWAVSSTFKGLAESQSASATLEPDRGPGPLSGSDPTAVRVRARQVATADPLSPADATATIVETGYRIQVTAAESAEEGRAVVARLAAKGYPAYMTRAVVGHSDVFRVRIGPFDTLSAAEDIATQLRADGYGGVWIAR